MKTLMRILPGIRSGFTGLLFLHCLSPIQGQDDSVRLHLPGTIGLFKPASPRIVLGLTAGRTVAFGPFAKGSFEKGGLEFDFNESKGGFAGRGIFLEGSVGVRMTGNLVLLFKASHQQIDLDHRDIKARLDEVYYHTRSWAISSGGWDISTLALGLSARNRLRCDKHFFFGWQIMGGLSFIHGPMYLSVKSNYLDGHRVRYYYEQNFVNHYPRSMSGIIGGHAGYRIGRCVALVLNTDLFITRTTQPAMEDQMWGSSGEPVRRDWITTFLPSLQLSVFLP